MVDCCGVGGVIRRLLYTEHAVVAMTDPASAGVPKRVASTELVV